MKRGERVGKIGNFQQRVSQKMPAIQQEDAGLPGVLHQSGRQGLLHCKASILDLHGFASSNFSSGNLRRLQRLLEGAHLHGGHFLG